MNDSKMFDDKLKTLNEKQDKLIKNARRATELIASIRDTICYGAVGSYKTEEDIDYAISCIKEWRLQLHALLK
jgi:uncharacterized protein YpuA (DUF1002 family)